MSAIAGIVRLTGEPVTTHDLHASAQRMVEPGLLPAQYWTQAGTGFVVRQSLITEEDLAEQQPWISQDGQRVLILDGRIDNRDELAAALGITLRGEADGWLLQQALERWQAAALPRLIGDFVFAYWDTRQQKLLLGRDKMGGRTLYYHQSHGQLAFASTYPALLALPGVPVKVDELGIADFLVLNMYHPVNTFWQEVRRLPRATLASYDPQGLKSSTYWTPQVGQLLHLSCDEEYVEAAREQLERAVACRLRARGRVASQISGGLDSSAVAVTAAKQLAPARLFAVCSVPPAGLALPPPGPEWYNDERPYLAEIAAQHPGLELHLASSQQPHWIETHPERFFEAAALPLRNITNVGWFLPGYEQVAQAGIQVLLDGQTGNAAWSFDGLRSLNDLFRQGHWIRLLRELYLTGQRAPYGWDWRRLLRQEVVRPALPAAWLRWRHPQQDSEPWARYSAINPAFAREIDLAERSRQAKHDAHFIGPQSATEMMLNMLQRSEHGPDVATALRSLTGIERRSPLLDPRLLAFFLSVPQNQFLQDGLSRRLARRALADRLPHSVLDKEKIGMQNPEIFHRLAQLRPDLPTEIHALSQSPLAARYVDLPRLSRIVRDWPQTGLDVQLALPRALNVARFLRWTEQGNDERIRVHSSETESRG